MGLFHRGKKNNDDEPDSVQTNSFSEYPFPLIFVCKKDLWQNI